MRSDSSTEGGGVTNLHKALHRDSPLREHPMRIRVVGTLRFNTNPAFTAQPIHGTVLNHDIPFQRRVTRKEREFLYSEDVVHGSSRIDCTRESISLSISEQREA